MKKIMITSALIALVLSSNASAVESQPSFMEWVEKVFTSDVATRARPRRW